MTRNKMAEGEMKRTISTCNKSRSSTWADSSTRTTTAGMKEVVTISIKDGRRYSTTSYEAP